MPPSTAIPRILAILASSMATVLILGPAPQAAQAQVVDTPQSDTLTGFPNRFELEGLRVVTERRFTITGGVGAVEMRLDSLASVPVPTLEQALREMPLVRVRTNSRGEAQPSLRGATDRQIAVLVDGVPLTLGWDHRTDLSIIPLTAARSIHLLRGLPSVLHGPNVLAGVVSIDVARGSERLEAPPPATLSASVDQEGGMVFGGTVSRSLESDGGQWLVQGGGGFRDRPGVSVPNSDSGTLGNVALLTDDGDLRLNSDLRHMDAFASLRYQGDEGGWMSLTSSGFDVERGVPPETHEVAPRFWRYPDQARVFTAFSGGTGPKETGWGMGDIEGSVGLDFGSFRLQQFDAPTFGNVIEEEEGDDRTVTFRVLGKHNVGERGDVRTALTYGDVSHTERLTASGAREFRQRLWSLGSEAVWRLDDLSGSESLGATHVNVGVSIDGADTPESGGLPPLGRLGDWGARLGLSSLTEGGSLLLHGGISRRARFPSLRELYSDALGRFVANPDLVPEVLTGMELGLTWDLQGVDIQVVGFHQVLSDGIVRIGVQTPEGPKRQRVNRDRIRSTGAEMVASGGWGVVQYSGDLTLQRAWQFDDIARLRTRPEYEPDVAGGFDAAVPIPGQVSLSGGYRFVGSQSCLNADTGSMDRLERTHRFDLQLRRLFGLEGRSTLANVDGLVSVTNVVDDAIFDQCGLPQPGRTFRIQLRLF
jgi:iron complex outermembrane receptor protein